VHITDHLFRDAFVNRLRCITSDANIKRDASIKRSIEPDRHCHARAFAHALENGRPLRAFDRLTPTSGLECARPHRQLQNLILQQSNEPAREP
jgi:hypothetical protein